MAAKSGMRLLRLYRFPILEQLQLEERLLRATSENWCILNDGTAPPSVVMGISGKPEQLLNVKAVVHDQIPVIRRFSGGGTVIVDEGTIFATLICSQGVDLSLQLYPRPIMQWMEQVYASVFARLPGFQLQEHDFVFGNRKVGGNAQSIIKGRWLHHTSFLWDYEATRMSYLKIPERHPSYRQARHHTDFVCRMREFLPSRDHFFDALISVLEQRFNLQECSIQHVAVDCERTFPQTTRLLPLEELQETLDTSVQPMVAS